MAGPATRGTARGKIRGSDLSGLNFSDRLEFPGKIMWIAIKKRITPPATKRVGLCMERASKRGLPIRVNKRMIARAMLDSRRMIEIRLLGFISWRTDRYIGMFPMGSIRRKRVKAMENMELFILCF